jgi:hypothetical protein
MLRTRFVAAIAAVLLFAGAAITGAAAQTATSQPTGKPLQLLKIVEQPGKTKAKPRVKLAAKPSGKHAIKIAAKTKTHTHVARAGRKRPALPMQTASAPQPGTIWPAGQTAPPAEVAVAAPAPQPEAVASAPAPGDVAVAAQTVQIAAPDEVNEIDLAANDAATQKNDAAPARGTANTPPLREIAGSAPKSDSIKSDSITAEAAAQPKANAVGSTSWVLQVLAALGGAATAGSVAWFLIGGAPQRTYG